MGRADGVDAAFLPDFNLTFIASRVGGGAERSQVMVLANALELHALPVKVESRGFPFNLSLIHISQTIGEAVVTDVRKEVCGALVQKLETPADPVRVGDSASVKTND